MSKMAEKETEIVEAGGDPEKACLVCLINPVMRDAMADAIIMVASGQFEGAPDVVHEWENWGDQWKGCAEHLLTHEKEIEIMTSQLKLAAIKLAEDIAYGRK